MSVSTVWTFVLCLFFSTALIAGNGSAQNVKEVVVSVYLDNATIPEAFEAIESQTVFSFLYNRSFVESIGKRLTLQYDSVTVEQVLVDISTQTGAQFRQSGRTIAADFSEAAAELLFTNVFQETITGRVVDSETGETLPGVTIRIKNTDRGTSTSVNGEFELSVESLQDTLVISSVGYRTMEVAIDGRSDIFIALQREIISGDELVVVGYGTQRRVSLTGAVSSVSTQEIVATKNENVQNMLTGKLPGVRVVQKTSEPGVFSNDFDIRGFGNPLIVIDGVPRDNMARLNPNDIESISVLKDASAAVYGVRAANGVVLITTKRGQPEQQLELNYSTTYSIQTPSGLPQTVGAIDWLTLINEQTLRSEGLTYEGAAPHSQDFINEYRDGTRQSIDWYPYVIQNTAPQTQHNLSASGGSENINYYVSLGYLYQEGFFESGDLNYERYNVRSNVTARISDALTVDLQVSGIMDERNQPHAGTWEIFKALWRQNPVDAPYANNNPEYLGLMASGTNAIGLSSADYSGYQINDNKWFQGSFSLGYEVPFIEGLRARGMYSYDHRTGTSKSYQRQYSLYTYNQSDGFYQPTTANAPSRVSRNFSESPTSLLQASLNYNQSFFGIHNIDALLLYEEQTRSADNFFAQRDLALTGLDELFGGITSNQIGSMNANNIYKFTNKGLVGKLNYDYNLKYLAEFSFRYDGSSKFPPGEQWGLFPAVSVGWRVSQEDFFKNTGADHVLNELKLRASYGVMGDDAASAYQFITGYNFPASRGGNNQGLQGGSVFGGNFVSAVEFSNLPNPNITWFEITTVNAGIDAELWNGLLGIEFDVFRRDRDGLLATRRLSLPGSLGAALPQENMNSDQVQGIEIMLRHRNAIGNLWYNISGNISVTRSRLVNYDQAEAVNSLDYWRNSRSNRFNDIIWGYQVIGQFESYEEIYNSDVYYGPNTIPGDFKYLDWNGDGVIDANDIHPIAFNDQTPKIYFGFSSEISFKSFDINLLFQGAALVNVAYPEQLMAPLAWNGSALDYFMDRWHPEDPAANPYNPNTTWVQGKYPYTGSTAVANSSFHIQDASYLRLKSLEIGYTLPGFGGIRNARIFANGYNLFTWSGIQYVDPEHPADTYGYVYPLNKTFNFGIDITF